MGRSPILFVCPNHSPVRLDNLAGGLVVPSLTELGELQEESWARIMNHCNESCVRTDVPVVIRDQEWDLPASDIDITNCYRLDQIRLALDELFLMRHSADHCATPAGVRQARSATISKIRAIVSPNWTPK